jgi:hypothetical protein
MNGRSRQGVWPIALGRSYIARDVAKFKEECTWVFTVKNEQWQRFSLWFDIKCSQMNRLRDCHFSNNEIAGFGRFFEAWPLQNALP